MEFPGGFIYNKKGHLPFFLIIAPLFLYLILIFVIPLPRRAIYVPYGRIIRYRDGRIMRMYVSSDEKWRFFIPLDSISPLLLKTTLAYEDRHFFWHLGINPLAILRALIVNVRHGKVVQGGSTLSMQLARIMEPKKRTIWAKLIEAFRANQMEIRLGKRRILELYFNLAPYGGNVEGIKAASLFYLGKSPEDINTFEAAFLVAIPQSPTERMPLPHNRHRIKKAVKKVLSAMLKDGIIDRRSFMEMIGREPVFYVRKPIIEAPHAADFIKMLYPDSLDIVSSIDRTVQKKAEGILNSYADYLKSHGAEDASIVVIENSTRKVRAIVGSLDYFDRRDGQVLGFYSFRSPGSALKPFLYTLALEKGIITSESLLPDAPLQFGDFSPKDFDEKYRGLVTAEYALSHSLNIPFVYLLRLVGYKNFIKILNRGGLKEMKRGRYYGLPVITGAKEVRLIDLTNLYVSLARGGMHGKYILLEHEKLNKEFPLFKSGAVYITLKALSLRNRPDKPVLGNLIREEYGPVYWKTGTSWGRRDALSIGFREHYTVGVWSGNFDGRGFRDIVGAILSAPIMFDILKAIDGGYFSGNFSWTEKALSEITLFDVCAFSGYRPTKYCRKHKKVMVLKSQLPYRLCPYHKLYRIEKQTGYRACPEKHYRKGELIDSIFLVLPQPARKIFGKSYAPPSFGPDCKLASDKKGFYIVSPQKDAHYFIEKDVNFEQGIPLIAYTDSKNPEISWFVDGEFYGKSKSGEALKLIINSGSHTVYAQDMDGRSASVDITVNK